MTTKNYYHYAKTEEVINPAFNKSHVFELPMRSCLIGGSGAGKTNTLLNMIERMPSTFVKIIICIPTNEEPLYELLKDKLKDKVEFYIGEVSSGKRGNKMIPNIPKIEDVAFEDDKGWAPILMVFDDWALADDQQRIINFYIRGRKKNISSIYISQSYYKIPITIRRNTTYNVIKRNVNESDLKKLWKLSGLSLKFENFLQLYRDSTRNMEDFMLIDMLKGDIYKGFELEPRFKTYADNETEGTDDNSERGVIKFKPEPEAISEEAKYEYAPDAYKYRTQVLMGVQSFIEALKHSYPNMHLPFRDLFELYQKFSTDYNYSVGTSRYLGQQLTKTFPKSKTDGSTPYYFIKVD